MNPGFLVKFCFFLKCFSSSLYHYDIGLQINTSTRKADFESVAFRTFDFENILNKTMKIQMKIYLTTLILKIHNILLLKSPHAT